MIPALRPIPKVKQPGTAAALIAVATSQVGYREGENNGTAFGLWYPMRNASWCAIFLSWCAAMSGCSKIVPKHAWTPAGADWFKERDRWGSKPRVGAFAYYYNASLRRIAHVEVVVKVYADGSWLACGGNTNTGGSRQGNGVYLLRRTSTRGGGFGYPKYVKPAPEPERETKPLIKVSQAIAGARDGRFAGPIAAALRAKQLPATTVGYARWQRSLGFTGDDADGTPGAWSLRKLARDTGLFRVKDDR